MNVQEKSYIDKIKKHVNIIIIIIFFLHTIAREVTLELKGQRLNLLVSRWPGYVVIFQMSVFYVQTITEKSDERQNEEK